MRSRNSARGTRRSQASSAARRRTCLKLARQGAEKLDTSDASSLGALLSDEDVEVREAASFALKCLAARAPRLAPALVEAVGGLTQEKTEAVVAVQQALVLAGPYGLEALRTALKRGQPTTRRRATHLLGLLAPLMPKRVLPALLAASRDEDREARLSAARALSALASAARVKASALAPLLSDSDFEVRAVAASGLARAGAVTLAAPLLQEAITHDSLTIRRVAAGALGAAGREALGALQALLADPDPALRALALSSLVELHLSVEEGQLSAGSSAVKHTCTALGDSTYEVRAAAAGALTAIGPPASLAALAPLFDAAVEPQGGDKFFISIPAVLALASMTPGVVPFLVRSLEQHDDARYRAAAATTLGEIGPGAAEAIPSLLQALSDPDWLVRLRAAAALTTTGRPADGLAHLAESRSASDWHVRAQTAFILGRLPEHAEFALPTLVAALDDSHPAVRRQAVESLGRWGEAAARAVPRLWRALDDGEQVVRRQALKSLEDILLYRERRRLMIVAQAGGAFS